MKPFMAEIFDLDLSDCLDALHVLSMDFAHELSHVDFENEIRCSYELLLSKIKSRAEKIISKEKRLGSIQKVLKEKLLTVNDRMQDFRSSLDKDYEAKSKILEDKQFQLDTLMEEQKNIFQKKMKDIEDKDTKLLERIEVFEKERQRFQEKRESFAADEQVLKTRLDDFEKEKQNLIQKIKLLEGERDAFHKRLANLEETNTAPSIVDEAQECIIKLDVGGHQFSTSLNTLSKDQSSMIAVMFSGRHTTFRSPNGSYFIDRDGTYFHYVLNYLRGGILSPGDLPDDPHILTALRRESDFYQIQGFTELLEECLEAPREKLDFSQEEITRMLSENNPFGIVRDSLQNDVDPSQHLGGAISSIGHNMTKCKLNFANKTLNGLSFAHATFLHDVSFRNARLVGANFYGCEFGRDVKVNFNDSDLTDCDFRQCKGKENGAKRTFAHGGGLLSMSSSQTFLNMVQEERITFKRAKMENTLFDSKVLDFLSSCHEK